MEIEELLKQLSAGGIHVEGDFVMKKEVQYEVNAAAGAVGFIINSGEASDGRQDVDSPLVTELLPVFMNVRSEVVAFIKAIDGLKPTGVTEKVNELVRAGKILKVNRKGVLHDILNRYGLYSPGLGTWNKQIN